MSGIAVNPVRIERHRQTSLAPHTPKIAVNPVRIESGNGKGPGDNQRPIAVNPVRIERMLNLKYLH